VQPGCFVPGVSDADFLVLHLPAGSAQEAAAVAEGLRAAAERLRLEFAHVLVKVRRLEGGAWWEGCPA